jgi:hypothetical protein
MQIPFLVFGNASAGSIVIITVDPGAIFIGLFNFR